MSAISQANFKAIFSRMHTVQRELNGLERIREDRVAVVLDEAISLLQEIDSLVPDMSNEYRLISARGFGIANALFQKAHYYLNKIQILESIYNMYPDPSLLGETIAYAMTAQNGQRSWLKRAIDLGGIVTGSCLVNIATGRTKSPYDGYILPLLENMIENIELVEDWVDPYTRTSGFSKVIESAIKNKDSKAAFDLIARNQEFFDNLKSTFNLAGTENNSNHFLVHVLYMSRSTESYITLHRYYPHIYQEVMKDGLTQMMLSSSVYMPERAVDVAKLPRTEAFDRDWILKEFSILAESGRLDDDAVSALEKHWKFVEKDLPLHVAATKTIGVKRYMRHYKQFSIQTGNSAFREEIIKDDKNAVRSVLCSNYKAFERYYVNAAKWVERSEEKVAFALAARLECGLTHESLKKLTKLYKDVFLGHPWTFESSWLPLHGLHQLAISCKDEDVKSFARSKLCDWFSEKPLCFKDLSFTEVAEYLDTDQVTVRLDDKGQLVICAIDDKNKAVPLYPTSLDWIIHGVRKQGMLPHLCKVMLRVIATHRPSLLADVSLSQYNVLKAYFFYDRPSDGKIVKNIKWSDPGVKRLRIESELSL